MVTLAKWKRDKKSIGKVKGGECQASLGLGLSFFQIPVFLLFWCTSRAEWEAQQRLAHWVGAFHQPKPCICEIIGWMLSSSLWHPSVISQITRWKSFYSVWLELLFTSKCYALISSYSPAYGFYCTFINLVITIIWIFLEVLDINTIQGQFMHCWKWEDSTRRVKCFLYETYHLLHVVCSHIAASGLVQLLHEFLINNVMISLLVHLK